MRTPVPLWIYVRRFFGEWLLTESPATQNTITTYRDALLLLLRFVAEETGRRPMELEVTHFNSDLVERFLTHCEEKRSNSAGSNNTRLSAIRSLFGYIARCEPRLNLRCQEVCSIRNREVCDKQGGTEATGYLTREELKALVSAPDCSSQLGRRDRTVLLLMSRRGLRVSEVIALSLQDVQLGEMDAHVICNAGSATERKTPLGQECQGALRNWVGERRVGPSDPLFSSTHGKALSQDAVQHLVRKHAKKASVHCPSLEGKRVSPHVLRRTAAKHLLQEGNDPDMVARWLGYRPGARIRIGPNSDGRLKEGPKNRSEVSGLYQPDQKDELLLFLESLDHG